jgi:hypothetical protein
MIINIYQNQQSILILKKIMKAHYLQYINLNYQKVLKIKMNKNLKINEQIQKSI